ncbi:LysR family transcriptional regulator [Azorhizobium oxalatiphilum]|uniref:LysR family transcriptional regulator n=1 Tax=Azorhizobium oxalatiphilum TaxID=980631 RepID=A0A917FB67_9HYPH|nr:LysR family transcriptional regulator [Azorhizobium oxalatiphilum]GGF64201.1 LysR family transcriptional regulator [Azorhizobium oxalatiphilum]
MRFDLVDLKLFLAILEAGSITAGAARANLALPSASARVRGMEETAGTPLLVRSRAGAVATPAGEALAHHARLILQQSERMRGELSRYGRGLKGHVRLWSNTAAFSVGLIGDLARFLARHPDVDVDLQERPSREIAPALRGGLIHIGLLSDVGDTLGLETRTYGEDVLMAVLPKGHRLANTPGAGFADVAALPFVGLTPGNAIHQLIETHAVALGLPLKYRVRVNRIEAVGEMVQAGVGVSVLPTADALRVAERTQVEVFTLPEAWARRRLVVAVRDLQALPEFARQFLDGLGG